MPACKNCRSQQIVKNGFIRSKQRYRCKTCGYNFVSGDGRTNPQTVVKRAFAVILMSLEALPIALSLSYLMSQSARCPIGSPAKLCCQIHLRYP